MQFQTAYIRRWLEEPGEEEFEVDVVPWWLCFTHVAYGNDLWPSELFALTEGRHLGWGNLDPTLLTDSNPGDVLKIPWSSQVHIDRSICEKKNAYNGADVFNGLGPYAHAQAILVRRASVVITGGEDLGNGYHLIPETNVAQSESAVFLRIQAEPKDWADNDYVSKVAFDADDVSFAINTEATDKTVLGVDCVILKPGESVVYTLGVPEGDIRNASAGTDIKWQVGEGPLVCSPPRLKGRVIP